MTNFCKVVMVLVLSLQFIGVTTYNDLEKMVDQGLDVISGRRKLDIEINDDGISVSTGMTKLEKMYALIAGGVLLVIILGCCIGCCCRARARQQSPTIVFQRLPESHDHRV